MENLRKNEPRVVTVEVNFWEILEEDISSQENEASPEPEACNENALDRPQEILLDDDPTVENQQDAEVEILEEQTNSRAKDYDLKLDKSQCLELTKILNPEASSLVWCKNVDGADDDLRLDKSNCSKLVSALAVGTKTSNNDMKNTGSKAEKSHLERNDTVCIENKTEMGRSKTLKRKTKTKFEEFRAKRAKFRRVKTDSSSDEDVQTLRRQVLDEPLELEI